MNNLSCIIIVLDQLKIFLEEKPFHNVIIDPRDLLIH